MDLLASMKTNFILTLLLFTICLSSIGQEKTYTFKGIVYAYNAPLKEAIVEVYDAGDLIYESTTKGNGKFEFDLQSEREFMVEISKEDMRLKTIWINTKRTQNIKSKIPAFGFDVYLKKEKITPYDELSEIPVTLIKYHPNKKEFYMDKTYENALKNKKKHIKENDILVR